MHDLIIEGLMESWSDQPVGFSSIDSSGMLAGGIDGSEEMLYSVDLK